MLVDYPVSRDVNVGARNPHPDFFDYLSRDRLVASSPCGTFNPRS